MACEEAGAPGAGLARSTDKCQDAHQSLCEPPCGRDVRRLVVPATDT